MSVSDRPAVAGSSPHLRALQHIQHRLVVMAEWAEEILDTTQAMAEEAIQAVDTLEAIMADLTATETATTVVAPHPAETTPVATILATATMDQPAAEAMPRTMVEMKEMLALLGLPTVEIRDTPEG